MRHTEFGQRVLALGLLAALFGHSQAHAGGFTIIEFGAKKTAMMTCVARPDDLSAVFHNPAGLADLSGTHFHLSSGLSFVTAGFRLHSWEGGEGVYGSEDFIDTPVDGEGYFEGTVRPTRYFGVMPMLAVSSDFGVAGGPVLALSVYVPDFIGAFLPDDAPTRYLVTEAYFVAGMASLSAGWRLPAPVDWLSLGASLGVIYVRIEGKRWVNVQLIGEENTDYVLRLLGEDVQPWGNFGLTADLPGGVRLGASVVSGTPVHLEGSLKIDLPPGQTEEHPLIIGLAGRGLVGDYHQTTTMQVPWGLAAGVEWQVLPELALAADFRYWFYRVFEEQTMTHDIDLEILGRAAVENPQITPKDYGDSWTISLGTLVRPLPDWLPLDLMLGWSYDTSPAPLRTKAADSPTTDLTGFSLGARYTFDERWRVTLGYYRYWYLKDTVTDSVLEPPQNSIFSGSVDTVSLQLEVKL